MKKTEIPFSCPVCHLDMRQSKPIRTVYTQVWFCGGPREPHEVIIKIRKDRIMEKPE